MKKIGFTLVELLAVIAIIAILVLVAMPRVLIIFNNAKMNSFVIEVQKIMDTASGEFMKDSLLNGSDAVYYSTSDSNELNSSKLALTGNNKEYFIEMDRNGNFKRVIVYDNNYCYDIYTEYGSSSIGNVSLSNSKKMTDENLNPQKITKSLVIMDDVNESGNDSVAVSVEKNGTIVSSYSVVGCSATLVNEDVGSGSGTDEDDYDSIDQTCRVEIGNSGELLYDAYLSYKDKYLKKYTGVHKDSYSVASSFDIYHMYANDNNIADEILDRNNVLFANQCWQILRNTDIGGIRMIYNGEVDDEGRCGTNRSTHYGYDTNIYSYAYLTLNDANYYYADGYTYSGSKFKLSSNLVKKSWNSSTASSLVGKYTCKSTNANDECSKLHLIVGYYDETSAYYTSLSNGKEYFSIGDLKYNFSAKTIADVGYMLKKDYYASRTNSINISQSTKSILDKSSFQTSYVYSPEIIYNTSTKKYKLVNPYKVGSIDELTNVYTLRSGTSSYEYGYTYYILGPVDNGYLAYIYYSDGKTKDDISTFNFAHSILDNGDGTYTLKNPISVSQIDWYSTYANYNNMYTCGNNEIVCNDPQLVISTTSTNYSYMNLSKASKRILIAKNRNGTSLQDTIIVNYAQLSSNLSLYSDYKYSCGNLSSECDLDSLIIFTSKTSSTLTYNTNGVYSRNVKYENGKYILIDNLEIENSIEKGLFTCIEPGKKECSKVAYIFEKSGNGFNYIFLDNGETNINNAINNILKYNSEDSLMKFGIDKWYEKNLSCYSNYIEDSIYCNDRDLQSYTTWLSGSTETVFRNYSIKDDLSCPNDTDKFSLSNPNANLKYPIALPTASELKLLNNNKLRNKNDYYWTMTPTKLYSPGALVHNVFSGGDFGNQRFVTHESSAIRPVITLKHDVRYIKGDGSTINPFFIQ